MTYINRLDSFDEVKAWYEKTPVLKSKDHPVEQDIRPIGKRRRKWERIIKITENCYALSCGGYVDPVFNWGWSGDRLKEFPITPKDTAKLSPIVWRKHKDGSETVTIRNGQGEWQHNSVYSFISRALPHELWFRINRQGRQAIYNRSEGKEYYLPKTKTVPRYRYEHLKREAAKHSWAKKHLNICMLDFDNMSLTFKRTAEGKFELIGEAPKEFVKRQRIDTDSKAKLKDSIEKFHDWALTMYPLMCGQLSWKFREEVRKEADTIAEKHKINGYVKRWTGLFGECDPNLTKAIISDDQHPLRHSFGIAAMFVIHEVIVEMDSNRSNGWDYGDLSDEEFEKLRRTKARAKFNSWINKMAGFAKTVNEEK